MIYDVIIVGGGPIGFMCHRSEKNNLSYLILEKGTLTNSLYHYPLYMTFFSTAERLEIGEIPFNCIAPKPGRQEALEYYRNVTRFFDLNIHLHEEVVSLQKTERFEVVTSKARYESKKVIIATGFYDVPHRLNVPGEDLPHVHHYFKEAHPYILQDVVVIGANNSAVDAALECYRKGANVTMLIRGSEFTSKLKYWVRPDIENRIAEGSIKAYFNTEIEAFTPTHVKFTSNSIPQSIQADSVLAMTGYEPNFQFLTSAGITLQDDYYLTPTYNEETLETNVEGLYLAGVVCGGLQTNIWFIENSRVHAQQIISHLKEVI
ncbi:YpdA family putative bacillithiol disulfide reductase [Faecalibacter sp. LW9]|uniref:YpdA family putative bacillithiol disulfide reductase n=1 Tax=Faecalibacter sp. LW9 TaxID=3103144 RepID=UPI002AFF6A1D